jgi:hypothetical protein
MRTTLTLDPDIEAKLRALARERRLSFKETVNAVLRRGLAEETVTARPFRVEAKPLGLRPGVDLDRALALAADLEDDEVIRKLELRK